MKNARSIQLGFKLQSYITSSFISWSLQEESQQKIIWKFFGCLKASSHQHLACWCIRANTFICKVLEGHSSKEMKDEWLWDHNSNAGNMRHLQEWGTIEDDRPWKLWCTLLDRWHGSWLRTMRPGSLSIYKKLGIGEVIVI